MNFKKLTPHLIVDDVNATVDFYHDILGFTLIASVPESGSFNFAIVHNGAVELMFQTGASVVEELPAMAGKLAGTGVALYIDVENVRALHEKLRQRVPLLAELHTTFYGATEFSITDPNGYIVTFAEHEGER
jgi:uncharacterized glyoxalase superfamily protein PhnB